MPLTILVVDDDLGTRLSICHYLEMCGYTAIAAENGQAGLLRVEECHPHLMVTDIIMPEMDGYELVRRVRQKPALRLLPVIFLTARTSTQERILGYQLGCDIYLPKPFELEELGAVIRNLLERNALIAHASRSPLIQTERQLAAKDTLPTSSKQELESQSPSGVIHPHYFEESLSPPQSSNLPIKLTQREQEVLDLLTIGLSNAQIGDRLHLSPRTVEKYVSSLLRKTETSNRAELVRFAITHHLVE